LPGELEPLARFSAPVYYVEGNHEKYVDAERSFALVKKLRSSRTLPRQECATSASRALSDSRGARRPIERASSVGSLGSASIALMPGYQEVSLSQAKANGGIKNVVLVQGGFVDGSGWQGVVRAAPGVLFY
jgi:hypothetical protein